MISSKPVQESNHIDSTDNQSELSTDDQFGPEWPSNITTESTNGGNNIYPAGDIADDVSSYSLHDIEFTLDKKKSRLWCCSKSHRKVIITTNGGGREINIYSKNGENLAEKNKIQFTHTNPIVSVHDDSIDLGRTDGTIVTLSSPNPMIITLLSDEINNHRQQIINLHDILWKWTYCLQSTVIRMVLSSRNTKTQKHDTQTRTLRYEKHIKTMSKHFITTALRYLTNHLQHSSHGYTHLLRCFFDKWYKEYNRNCIKESIKKNHEKIQCITNLFNNDVQNKFLTPMQQQHTNKLSETTRIANHVNSVNKELKQIVSNLQSITYCSNENAVSDYADSEKINIVKNLQHLADLRHHLQTMNNEEEEFILIGDQSSGKSSLLCMLLGVNIGYTSEHFATRCPVRYQLEPSPPGQGWHYQFENPQTKEFEKVTQEELQKKLTVHFEKVIGRQIVYNPITIKIHSPVCTSSMTLVDLPGLVGKGTDKIKQAQHSKSYHIVQEYLRKQNNIVLFVQRVDLDVGSLNTTILDEVQKRTPDKVVYCLTHFDRLCSDKDVRLEEIMRIITSAQKDIACNKDMFLLSLSKRVEDLTEKEHLTYDIINRLRAEYPEKFRRNTIHFNIGSLKKFLRKNIHKHVNQIEGVVYQFIHQQREYLLEHTHYINRSLIEPVINDVVLEQFIELFKKKTIKLLKGQFLPERGGGEQLFFETLQTEVINANKYATQNNVAVWPPRDMKKRPVINRKNSSTPPNEFTADHLDSASSFSDSMNDGEPVLVFENSPKSSTLDDMEDHKSNISDISHPSVNTIRLSIIPEVDEINFESRHHLRNCYRSQYKFRRP